MNTVYEAVVERALQAGTVQIDPDWTVEGHGLLEH